ncbi:hypothetical protein ACFSJ3_11255 [Corallincola platygyrae]|uniref:Uncharacterized protein n=1 Tax=Corallincola platygyrae TaxID=1193278 RepID=A0ABW4XLW1_9GAMM
MKTPFTCAIAVISLFFAASAASTPTPQEAEALANKMEQSLAKLERLQPRLDTINDYTRTINETLDQVTEQNDRASIGDEMIQAALSSDTAAEAIGKVVEFRKSQKSQLNSSIDGLYHSLNDLLPELRAMSDEQSCHSQLADITSEISNSMPLWSEWIALDVGVVKERGEAYARSVGFVGLHLLAGKAQVIALNCTM